MIGHKPIFYGNTVYLQYFIFLREYKKKMSKKRSELKHKRKIHDEQNMLDDTSLSKHLQIILFYVM